MNRLIILIPFAALALLGTGIGLAVTGTQPFAKNDMDPIQLAQGTSPQRFTGPPSSPQALLDEVLSGLQGTEIVEVKLGVAPDGSSAVEREVPGTVPLAKPEGLFLYATVPAAGESGDAVRAIWEATLIGGALNDHLRGRSLGRLASVQILQPGDDGTLQSVGGGIGNTVQAQEFSTATPAEMAARIRTGAEAAGLRVVSLDFHKPAQVAPALVVSSSDPDAVVDRSASPTFLDGIFGDTANLEGLYFEVRDDTNAPILKLAAANRAGAGQSWMHERYRHAAGELGATRTP